MGPSTPRLPRPHPRALLLDNVPPRPLPTRGLEGTELNVCSGNHRSRGGVRTSRHAPDGGGDADQHRKPPTHNQRRGQTEPLATGEGVRACLCVHLCESAWACVCARMWEKQDAAEVTPNEAISHECQQEGKEASFREGAFCLTHAASPVPCAEREGPLRGSEGTLGVAGWDPDTLSPRSAATWTLGKCTRARVQLGGTATQAQATQPRRFSGASCTKCATQAPEWGGAPAPTPQAASRELPACSAAVLAHSTALTACRGSGRSVLAVAESRRGLGFASAAGQPLMLRGVSCSIMRWQGGRGALGLPADASGDRAGGGLSGAPRVHTVQAQALSAFTPAT